MAESDVLPIAVASAVTDVNVYAKPCKFMGYSMANDGTATAKVYFRNSAAADMTKPKVWGPITLIAGESTRDGFFPDGILCTEGLALDRDGTNAVEMVVLVKTL